MRLKDVEDAEHHAVPLALLESATRPLAPRTVDGYPTSR